MDDFRKLVYTRLQSFPRGYSISVGEFGQITKEEALTHVAENDQIGKVLIQIDREYFDALKTGNIYANTSD